MDPLICVECMMSVCKHVWICLVCLGQCMSVNFMSIQFNTPRCRFRVPVLQPRSRQPAHLLKHNMYTSVGALGWSVGGGQPLVETTSYKQSLLLKFYFHSVFSLNLWFGWGRKGVLDSTFCKIIIATVWERGVYRGKKNPSRNVVLVTSLRNTGLLLCSSMYFRNCFRVLLKRMHYNWIVLHQEK